MQNLLLFYRLNMPTFQALLDVTLCQAEFGYIDSQTGVWERE